MEQNNRRPSQTLERFLRIYRIEPVGQLLSDRLKLPLPIVWLLFAGLYFGVLFVLHSVAGTPIPSVIGDLSPRPSTSYCYPNFIGITYDLVGNPLLLTLLIFFRSHIFDQFVQLERSGFIREKPRTSRIDRLLYFLGTNSRIQTLLVVVLPLLVAILGLVVDIRVYSPRGAPSQYSVFLSLLGRYARVASLIQFVYVFVILARYRFDFGLHFGHPDGCSGLAPFGRLATAGYIYLFVHAVMQAIGTAVGGTALERALRDIAGAFTLVYLWVLFPIAALFIFGQLVHRPHRVLRRLQEQYLYYASTAWTSYHRQITSSIAGAVEQSDTSIADGANRNFGDDAELLEVWAKLNKYVEDMHTWPIPKRTLRVIAIVGNPLIPVLFPVVVDVVRSLLP